MSELKLISPMLDGFMMGDPISDHDGVRCCPAMREDSDDKYIVKIISVPASQKQLDALLLTGAYKDAGAATEYFKQLADETVKEVRLLQQLAKLEGFLPYEGWQVVPMEGSELGYDVYLLGSYKRSLEKYLRRNAMTHLNAVNLGIDLCNALSLCRRAGFIYTDLKPGNIYISAQQEYRIGDIGFSKLSAMKYTSMPGKYISRYTPPELHDPLATLNPTVDTYALGMILYQIYNNGELPFQTKAPLKHLATPFNADYELAEIIQKAIDPNPRKRYQTPIEMGQALVSYMQRNTVNDTPIVPPLVETAPVQSDAPAAETTVPVQAEPVAVEEPAAVEESAAVEEIPAIEETESLPEELRFMEELVSDETAPSADAGDDLVAAQTTDEVDLILAQADALISHESDIVPDFEDTAAEAEEAPAQSEEMHFPVFETDAEEAADVTDGFDIPVIDGADTISVDAPDEEAPISEHSAQREEVEDDAEAEFGVSFEDFGTESGGDDNADADLEFGLPRETFEPITNSAGGGTVATAEKEPKPRKKHGWIGFVITLLFLALVGGGAWYYYSNFYLLGIDNMAITGIEGGISVELTTDADKSLIKILCTDTYGNKQEKQLSGNKAEFTGLTPDTTYKILVEAEGLHKASGSISGSYTTAKVTDIVDFTAKNGTEDGSVVLNFTVDGPETQDWIVEYVADGEETKSVSFTGHMVSITDLTVGKVYTFTLVSPPAAELYLVGNTTLEHLASETVLAQDLSIVSFADGVLTAQWSIGEGLSAESWSVRCYADGGFDETITVNETTAQFKGLSSDTAYTVEVTAAGMSQSARAFVTANPATVSNVQVAFAKETGLTLTWESDIESKDGWLVLFSVDGSDTTEMADCTDKSAVIKNVIPNAAYELQIRCADGATVFGGAVTFDGFEAVPFNKHGVSASNVQSSMCHTPEKENWTYEDVNDNRYTTSYAPGEKASLVLYTNAQFFFRADPMAVMYVIRNAEGKIIPGLCRTVDMVWREMWPSFGKYCYLDIPVMPTVEGNYKLEVYFNGDTMLTKNFSIITANG